MFISREGPILGMQIGVTKNLLINKNFSYFTYSREALIEILKFNKISSGDEILLPNYLCSEVIESIFSITENIKYYTINDSLSYSKSEVSGLISNKTRLIIFVDYFGVETRVDKDLELELKNNKIILVKDSSHSFLSLVNRNFNKDYQYDYLISSIYKNIPLQVGSIATASFDKANNFINLSILIQRYIVLFLKNIICFFGQNGFINNSNCFNSNINSNNNNNNTNSNTNTSSDQYQFSLEDSHGLIPRLNYFESDINQEKYLSFCLTELAPYLKAFKDTLLSKDCMGVDIREECKQLRDALTEHLAIMTQLYTFCQHLQSTTDKTKDICKQLQAKLQFQSKLYHEKNME